MKRDFLLKRVGGRLGCRMWATRPKGRLNCASNGFPATTLPIWLSRTTDGARGTSCCWSRATSRGGGPSDGGLQKIGPEGSWADSIGSHDTWGSAKVAHVAPLMARLRPTNPTAGAGAGGGGAGTGAAGAGVGRPGAGRGTAGSLVRAGGWLLTMPSLAARLGMIATPKRSTLVERSSNAVKPVRPMVAAASAILFEVNRVSGSAGSDPETACPAVRAPAAPAGAGTIAKLSATSFPPAHKAMVFSPLGCCWVMKPMPKVAAYGSARVGSSHCAAKKTATPQCVK